MDTFSNKVAVVTGAASGIGRALALQLATEGAQLALSDIDREGVDETRAAAENLGARVHAAKLDVSDREAFFAYADRVVEHFGAVHLVVNNAGVGLAAPIRAMPIEDLEWLMGINYWGVVYGTKAFLPHLESAGEGHIVNISSVFGIIAVPEQSAYNSAKFAVRGFTESLREELDMADNGVSCSCVHPGGIQTAIARNARIHAEAGVDHQTAISKFETAARTSPEQAARVILRGVRRNDRRILIGADARFVDWLQRLLPTAYQRLVVRAAKREMGK